MDIPLRPGQELICSRCSKKLNEKNAKFIFQDGWTVGECIFCELCSKDAMLEIEKSKGRNLYVIFLMIIFGGSFFLMPFGPIIVIILGGYFYQKMYGM